MMRELALPSCALGWDERCNLNVPLPVTVSGGPGPARDHDAESELGFCGLP